MFYNVPFKGKIQNDNIQILKGLQKFQILFCIPKMPDIFW